MSESDKLIEGLKTRFDPRIVFPDELSRQAVAEIERLRREVIDLRAALAEQEAEMDKLREIAAQYECS